MKPAAGAVSVFVIAMGVSIAAPPAVAADNLPGCGAIAECMQRLLATTDQLTQQNQALEKKVAALERSLAVASDAVTQLRDRKTTLVNRGGDRDFPQGLFWPGTGITHVNYTCPNRNVLVGMEFEMSTDGVARHPSDIKFICRELNP